MALIIAEAGINHCGNWNMAHELIKIAKDVGADIWKTQVYDPFELFGPDGQTPNPEILD
ncbi:hypothetical protein LCGC14_2611620, partial [marine sediment metagenome]